MNRFYRRLAAFEQQDPAGVASIAVVCGDHILMGLRRDSMKWTLPGGHIESGEDPAVGGKRELSEEAGIEAPHLVLLGCEDVDTDEGKRRIYAYRYDTYKRPSTTVYDPDREVYAWHWIDIRKGLPEEIKQNLHAPRNVTLGLMDLLGRN